MGETLAQASLFMSFTTIMKTFEVSTVPGEPKPTTEPLPAFTMSAQPFEMIVKERNSESEALAG
jgi:hypothetical protein